MGWQLTFDAVIDFDAFMRSAEDPSRLQPAYDSGDHLYPSIAGYRAMAEFVPLDPFKELSDVSRDSGCAAMQ